MSENKLDSIGASVYRRFGILLLIIGTTFGLDTFFQLHLAHRLWPLIISILGIGFIGIYVKRRKQGVAYLSIGLYLVFFSILALYCNYTSWKSLGSFWPAFILFLGLSLSSVFIYDKSRRLIFFLGLILVSLSLVLYLVFTINTTLWWTSFVFSGLSVLISERAK